MVGNYPKPRDRSRPVGAAPDSPSATYDSGSFTLPAGTAFSTVARFAGRPDFIGITCTAVGTEARLTDIGENPGPTFDAARFGIVGDLPGRDLLEARDPAGVGGQVVHWRAIYNDKARSVPI